MFAVSDIILLVFAAVFSLGVLTLDFSIFVKFKQNLAQEIASETGLFDIYFNVCSNQTLEMIRSLRYYEDAYRESLVELVGETLSLPEMLLVLGMLRVRSAFKTKPEFSSLTAQAQSVANFYIDVARLQLWHASPPSGPHAQRLCSRWRRRIT